LERTKKPPDPAVDLGRVIIVDGLAVLVRWARLSVDRSVVGLIIDHQKGNAAHDVKTGFWISFLLDIGSPAVQIAQYRCVLLHHQQYRVTASGLDPYLISDSLLKIPPLIAARQGVRMQERSLHSSHPDARIALVEAE